MSETQKRPPGEIAARIRRVLERHAEVLEAYLFGSLARGHAAPHSDVDVAVHLDERRHEGYGYGAAAEIAAELMAALGENRVDVVVLNRASPLLYHRVLRDGIRLFSRDLAATTTREGRALSRYCDYVPQLAKIDAARRAARRAAEGA
jgi:predicted nucleotidyltransferase